MASSLPVVFVLALVLGLMGASWTFTRKGPNQTYVLDVCCNYSLSTNIRLIRTSLLLTLTCCYLMWAVTYLAQVHPLIGAFHVKSDLRLCTNEHIQHLFGRRVRQTVHIRHGTRRSVGPEPLRTLYLYSSQAHLIHIPMKSNGTLVALPDRT